MVLKLPARSIRALVLLPIALSAFAQIDCSATPGSGGSGGSGGSDPVPATSVEVSDLMVMVEADGGTFFGFTDPDGNSWAVQEIKARAHKPLIPDDHTGLRDWASP